jgi:hypothetical protein
MNALISADEVDVLLKKSTAYSQRELMQLASFSLPSLESQYNDLSYSDKLRVRKLEGLNLFHYMNACRIATGADENGLKILCISDKYASLISQIKEVAHEEAPSNDIEQMLYASIVVKMILSYGDLRFNVKFQGEIPRKIFAFRQITADEWLSNLSTIYTKIVSKVASQNGVNAVLDFLFMLFIIVFNYSNIRKFSSNSIIQCDSQAVLCYNSSNISKRINFSDKICLGPFPGEKGGTPCQRKCPCPQNPFRKSLPLSDPTSEN